MAQKTDAQLLAEAQIIRNETVKGANTAQRVGDMLVDIVYSKINVAEAGAITVTYSELTDLINASALVVGQLYKITGVDSALYGGTDILIKAATINKLETTGSGVFFTPTYGNFPIWSNYIRCSLTSLSGTFSNGELVTANNGATANFINNELLNFVSGDWVGAASITGENSGVTADIGASASPSYAQGNKVIWGGKIWTNITGNIGYFEDPYSLNSTDWSVITFNESDYNIGVDEIKYFAEFDKILYRKDKYGNTVDSNNQTFGHDSIKLFQWGNIIVNNNIIENSVLECVNANNTYIHHNAIRSNSYVGDGNIYDNAAITYCNLWDSYIGNNFFLTSSYIDQFNMFDSAFYGNTLINNSYFESAILNFSYISNNNLDNSAFYQLELTNSAYVSYNNLKDSYFMVNKLDKNSYISYNTFYNIYLNYSNLDTYSKIYNNTCLNGALFQYNTLSNTSAIQNNTVIQVGYFENNTLNFNSNIESNTLGFYCSISGNTLLRASSIAGNTMESQNQISANYMIGSGIGNNPMESDSSILHNNMDSSDIVVNTMINGSIIWSNEVSNSSILYNNLDGGTINKNTLEVNSIIQYATLDESGVLQYNSFFKSTIDLQATGTLSTRLEFLTTNNVTLDLNLSSATYIYLPISKAISMSYGVVGGNKAKLSYINGDTNTITIVNPNN